MAFGFVSYSVAAPYRCRDTIVSECVHFGTSILPTARLVNPTQTNQSTGYSLIQMCLNSAVVQRLQNLWIIRVSPPAIFIYTKPLSAPVQITDYFDFAIATGTALPTQRSSSLPPRFSQTPCRWWGGNSFSLTSGNQIGALSLVPSQALSQNTNSNLTLSGGNPGSGFSPPSSRPPISPSRSFSLLPELSRLMRFSHRLAKANARIRGRQMGNLR